MGFRDHNKEAGRVRLRSVLIVAVIIPLIYGLYKLLPWLWHGWTTLRYEIKAWWYAQLAEPILRLLIYLLLAVQGRPVVALSLIALLYFLFYRIVATATSVGYRKMGQQPQILQENLIGQMENIQGKLKSL